MPISRNPLVGVVMGSDSDMPVMQEAINTLAKFGVSYEARILSAHRSPSNTTEYAQQALKRGLKVLIAAAGMAAHLPGSLAANTILPVIGVPIDSSPLKGVDALYSIVQMPPGVPVATMSIGKAGATNAALFAIQVLATSEKNIDLRDALLKYKIDLDYQVGSKDALLQSKLWDEGV